MDPVDGRISKAIEIDQIAMAVPSEITAEQMMKRMGGDWIEDTVIFEEMADRNQGKYQLYFNYDLGIEFEILVWKAGPFWLLGQLETMREPVLSHYGLHVKNAVASASGAAHRYGAPILQAVETIQHTNPFLIDEKRRYRYAIVGTRDLLGADLKFIERIE